MEPVYSRSPLTLSSDALWEEPPWSRTSPLTDETVTSLASMSSTRTSPLTLSMSACLPDRLLRTSTFPETDLACTSSETSVTRTSPLTDCAFAAPATPTRRTVSEPGHLDVDALQELRIPLILDALDGVDHDRRARPALDVDVARDVADGERGVRTDVQSPVEAFFPLRPSARGN